MKWEDCYASAIMQCRAPQNPSCSLQATDLERENGELRAMVSQTLAAARSMHLQVAPTLQQAALRLGVPS